MFTPGIIPAPENPLMGMTGEVEEFGAVDLELQNQKVLWYCHGVV